MEVGLPGIYRRGRNWLWLPFLSPSLLHGMAHHSPCLHLSQRFEFVCNLGEGLSGDWPFVFCHVSLIERAPIFSPTTTVYIIGAYGQVWKCLDRETGQMIAMKRFKEVRA